MKINRLFLIFSISAIINFTFAGWLNDDEAQNKEIESIKESIN